MLNTDEAAELVGISFEKEKEVFQKLDELMPGIVAVTDGPNGVVVSDGKNIYRAGVPDSPIVERTGAGDAFSSAFTAALALGMDIPQALSWGPINSMSVVQQIGARAGLLTRTEIEKYLAQAPADYKPQLLY